MHRTHEVRGGVGHHFVWLQSDFAELWIDFAALRNEFAPLKIDFAALKNDFPALQIDFADV